jgi:hypothetical protein
MSSLFFVVCIVAIACTASTVQHYLKLRAGKQDSSSDLQETLSQLEQIEKRMQVLERIVTERNIDLKQEINKL